MQHRENVMTHGPLPKGIDVTANGNIPQYSVRRSGKMRTFVNHPLSPSGRKEWGELLEGAGEEQGTRASVPGAVHPPIIAFAT
jgi:hypothetical protein